MSPLKWPLWLRCQLAGLVYAFAMDRPRTVFMTMVCVGVGAVLGLVLWGVVRVQERRVFGDLAEPERASAVRAVGAAQPPDDPRVLAAATRIARRWAKPTWQIGFQVVVWGLAVLLGIYLGISVTPWGWAFVVIFALVGGHSVRSELRQRRAGERFLRAATAVVS